MTGMRKMRSDTQAKAEEKQYFNGLQGKGNTVLLHTSKCKPFTLHRS